MIDSPKASDCPLTIKTNNLFTLRRRPTCLLLLFVGILYMFIYVQAAPAIRVQYVMCAVAYKSKVTHQRITICFRQTHTHSLTLTQTHTNI